MKIWVKMVMLFALAIMLSAEERPNVHKVVFDLTTDSVATLEKRIISGIITHYDHHQSRLESLESVVVIHGGAYRFFIKSIKDTPYADDVKLKMVKKRLAKRLASLHEHYGVVFRVCSIGMKKKKIPLSNFYSFVEPVFSSLTELIERQNAGYAYIPVR